ncbi:MAG: hypothetical protein Q7K39_01940 [Candidatus Magasanikbacteria bacterium]|nr:hypothetical protein [Candidatus Magasanikbacteria bacterium]
MKEGLTRPHAAEEQTAPRKRGVGERALRSAAIAAGMFAAGMGIADKLKHSAEQNDTTYAEKDSGTSNDKQIREFEIRKGITFSDQQRDDINRKALRLLKEKMDDISKHGGTVGYRKGSYEELRTISVAEALLRVARNRDTGESR